jgi:hypothetical protein
MSGTTPEPAPAAGAPAPSVAPAPAPAPAGDPPAPAAGTAPAPPAGPSPAEPAAPAVPPTESLLEAAGKPPEAKPGEKAPEPEKPAEPPAPEKIAYDLKLPEGFTAAPEQMSAATDLFNQAKVPPELAQKLIDQHVASMRAYAEQTLANQWKVFNEAKDGWRTATLADPELGGSGHATAMAAIATARDALVPEKDRPAFKKLLDDSGIGNNPAFLRVFYRAAKFFKEPSPPPPNPLPPPNLGRKEKPGMTSLYTSQAHKAALGRG